MTINSLMPDLPIKPLVQNAQNLNIDNLIGQGGPNTEGSSFADTLGTMMEDINTLPGRFNPEAPNMQIQNIEGPSMFNIGDLSGPKLTDSISDFMHDVNSLQNQAGELTDRFVKGEPVDIHEVMIAAEKSKTSFQLLMEIRNKFTDMYKEVLRMQI